MMAGHTDKTETAAPRDKRASRAWLRALELTAPIAKARWRTFPSVIEELAGKFGDSPALLADGESLSFYALNERANRYARWARAHDVQAGDTVCLLMTNRPEYMAIWLGITRIGGVVALLNTNLVAMSLAHCVDVVAPKHIIVASDRTEILENARPFLATSAMIWSHGAGPPHYPDVAAEIANFPGAPLTGHESSPPSIDDLALYVYTSGTTGLPKAAKISHYRLMIWTHWFAGMMETGPADCMYNCLPMYHSVGGAVATGAVLVVGGSVVIREKFSASRFWEDVVRFDCTLFQYIGELCRYLLRAPTHHHETQHRLRLCCGNGLRGDIWEAFRQRFHIPQILEFYGATEANVSLFNVEGRPGAIGRMAPFIAHRPALALVRFDIECNEILRDKNGFCIGCAANETGEAIGRISDDARFDGYTDREATEKKILRDVFARGDAWFRTGDLMRRDYGGFYYFVDRIGDTFRWKGENVATSEVAAAITAFHGIVDANVYGVAVPGADGRAGMAEIVCSSAIDFCAFREHLARHLPKYAHPVLLLIRKEIDVTPTFKQLKRRDADGYDPDRCPDALYVNDPDRGAYVAMDRELYDRIRKGQMQL
ncbi:MAG TPA: long-chain-acyl-CoA synthetase [Xanthobacteraceae bacterium]|nr:long-chain-acyl-CoA synthetase [Xanthobacteraceae bacterium]